MTGDGERELLLLRHGHAGRAGFGGDRARPLTAMGMRDVESIGAWLRANALAPDLAMASPATRARATAETALGVAADLDDRIYNADVDDLLDVLADCGDGPPRVMLVGHNPGFEDLVSYLAARAVRMSPGTLVRLAMPREWFALARGCASIVDTVAPSS